jgi:hypothetical protein
VRCAGFLGKWGGGERGVVKEEKKTFFPCLQRVQGKKMANSAIETTPFIYLFFITVNEMTSFCTKRAILFKRKWHQKVFVSKSILNFLFVQFSPQLRFWS